MKIKLLFFLFILCLACGTRKAETPPNQLTEQQKSEGWKLLFDGQTTNGWRIFKDKENDTWEVSDGTLHCKAMGDSVGTKRADLMTIEEFGSFELLFDWKIAAQANSGLIYRVTEEFEVPYGSGPEYQIIDDTGYPGDLKPVNTTAANYDMEAPQNNKLNPVGEWNSGKIVVNENHVEHWLNGVKVVEYELGSEAWKKQVAGCKWKDFPGYGLAKTGHIDLQDHGHEIWFRNIYIKTL